MEATAASYSPRLAALFDPEVPRDRLLIALGETIMEKGFAETVVADIVKRARVSRRTFYEEFADRSECFLELCDRATAVSRDVIEAAADPALSWEEQSKNAVDAYFAFMSADIKLTRSMLFEIYGLGERGMAAHRRTHHQFAEQLHRLAARAREAEPSMKAIDYPTACAVVAAIYELILLTSEEPARASLDEARATAVQLVLSVGHAD